jgi:hypothetical protein
VFCVIYFYLGLPGRQVYKPVLQGQYKISKLVVKGKGANKNENFTSTYLDTLNQTASIKIP